MGLEGVEIIMEVEEAFDITLDDAEAEKTVTPRDLIDAVIKKVAHADPEGCLTQRAFNRLRAVLLRRLPLKRRDVAPGVWMKDLVPCREREGLIKQLAADLETPTLPELVRPQWLVALLVAVCLGLGVMVAVLGFIQRLWDHNGLMVFVALLTAAIAGFLSGLITLPFRRSFPPVIASVGDLSRWIVANKSDLSSARLGTWTREQVAARIRQITVNHLSNAAAYREDASFVKDMGIN